MEIVPFWELIKDQIFGKINNMNLKNRIHRFFLGLVVICLTNCTEEFVPKTETFESLLVIEGNITNELKQHKIQLSKTFRFEDESGTFGESNAEVIVVDSDQNEYVFEETDSGVYISTTSFQAISGLEYTLSIRTSDGKSYVSDPVVLPAETEIDNLYAERMTNDDGLEGVGIFVDSFDATGNASFYRYEYAETYRFVAPSFSFIDLEVISEDPFVVDFTPRPIEKRTCYKTDLSTDIILAKTEGLNENRISRFLVHFVGTDDYSISDRYSIQVNQFVQSREAQVFYETIEDFSGSETLFSQIQPGFIAGNINAIENPDENVLGFFQVSSVSSKRIFFNYRDFFVVEDLPPYFFSCDGIAPPIMPSPVFFLSVYNTGLFLFVEETGVNDVETGPYLLVIKECGDCTEIGNSEVPEFWEN